MTADPIPGRSLVTRRAVRDLVRTAALSVYGVSGLAGGGPLASLFERLGIGHPGLHVEVERELGVEIHLTVAYGLPVAEVARQVDASIRYVLRTALDRDPDRVVIHVAGLRAEPGGLPPGAIGESADGPASGDLAASGTDVA